MLNPHVANNYQDLPEKSFSDIFIDKEGALCDLVFENREKKDCNQIAIEKCERTKMPKLLSPPNRADAGFYTGDSGSSADSVLLNWVTQPMTANSDVKFNSLQVNNLTAVGNVLFSGNVSNVQTEHLLVTDSILNVNANNTTSLLTGGIRVQRGPGTSPFDILYCETDQLLRIGVNTADSSSTNETMVDTSTLNIVATRALNQVDGGIVTWNSTTSCFETSIQAFDELDTNLITFPGSTFTTTSSGNLLITSTSTTLHGNTIINELTIGTSVLTSVNGNLSITNALSFAGGLFSENSDGSLLITSPTSTFNGNVAINGTMTQGNGTTVSSNGGNFSVSAVGNLLLNAGANYSVVLSPTVTIGSGYLSSATNDITMGTSGNIHLSSQNVCLQTNTTLYFDTINSNCINSYQGKLILTSPNGVALQAPQVSISGTLVTSTVASLGDLSLQPSGSVKLGVGTPVVFSNAGERILSTIGGQLQLIATQTMVLTAPTLSFNGLTIIGTTFNATQPIVFQPVVQVTTLTFSTPPAASAYSPNISYQTNGLTINGGNAVVVSSPLICTSGIQSDLLLKNTSGVVVLSASAEASVPLSLCAATAIQFTTSTDNTSGYTVGRLTESLVFNVPLATAYTTHTVVPNIDFTAGGSTFATLDPVSGFFTEIIQASTITALTSITSPSVTCATLTVTSAQIPTLTTGTLTTGTLTTTSDFNLQGNRIYNFSIPTYDSDAVNKSYVDSLFTGITAKPAVQVSTTGFIELQNVIPIIDGVTLVTGMRVLVKDQPNPIQNGIYEVQLSGLLTRSDDLPSGSSASGVTVYVSTGTVNGGAGFVTIGASLTVDTDPITFTYLSGVSTINVQSGLLKSGNVLSLNTDSTLSTQSGYLGINPTFASMGLLMTSNVLQTSTNQSHVTQIGTISSGTWQASTLQVSYGGTGATSFSTNSVLIGNGNNAIQSSAVTVISTSYNSGLSFGNASVSFDSQQDQFDISSSGQISIGGTSVFIESNLILNGGLTFGGTPFSFSLGTDGSVVLNSTAGLTLTGTTVSVAGMEIIKSSNYTTATTDGTGGFQLVSGGLVVPGFLQFGGTAGNASNAFTAQVSNGNLQISGTGTGTGNVVISNLQVGTVQFVASSNGVTISPSNITTTPPTVLIQNTNVLLSSGTSSVSYTSNGLNVNCPVEMSNALTLTTGGSISFSTGNSFEGVLPSVGWFYLGILSTGRTTVSTSLSWSCELTNSTSGITTLLQIFDRTVANLIVYESLGVFYIFMHVFTAPCRLSILEAASQLLPVFEGAGAMPNGTTSGFSGVGASAWEVYFNLMTSQSNVNMTLGNLTVYGTTTVADSTLSGTTVIDGQLAANCTDIAFISPIVSFSDTSNNTTTVQGNNITLSGSGSVSFAGQSSLTATSSTLTLGFTQSGSLQMTPTTSTVNSNLTVTGTTSVQQLTANSIVLGTNTLTGTSGALNVAGARLANVADPVSNSDAVTLQYLQSRLQGLNPKDSVVAATTANLDLTVPVTVIDGLVISPGSRILVKNQSNGINNGVYITQSGAAPQRSSDFQTSTSAAAAFFFVSTGGTANGGTGWVCNNTLGSDIVGTNALVFVQFSSSTQSSAGPGLIINGSALSVNVDNSTLEISPNNHIRVASGLAGTGLGGGSGSPLSVTSISHLSTLGTITSGTWNGSTIGTSWGGTGNSQFIPDGLVYYDGTKLTTLSNFTFDPVNLRLGINTATPTSGLSLVDRDISLSTSGSTSSSILLSSTTTTFGLRNNGATLVLSAGTGSNKSTLSDILQITQSGFLTVTGLTTSSISIGNYQITTNGFSSSTGIIPITGTSYISFGTAMQVGYIGTNVGISTSSNDLIFTAGTNTNQLVLSASTGSVIIGISLTSPSISTMSLSVSGQITGNNGVCTVSGTLQVVSGGTLSISPSSITSNVSLSMNASSITINSPLSVPYVVTVSSLVATSIMTPLITNSTGNTIALGNGVVTISSNVLQLQGTSALLFSVSGTTHYIQSQASALAIEVGSSVITLNTNGVTIGGNLYIGNQVSVTTSGVTSSTDFTIASTEGGTMTIGTSIQSTSLVVTGALSVKSTAGTPLFAFGSSGMNACGSSITNVATPVSGSDVATKSYVDSKMLGLQIKATIDVASVVNVNIINQLPAINGQVTVDGVIVSPGYRVLLMCQTNAVENGIYVINSLYFLSRALDLQAGASASGVFCLVEQGVTNGAKGYLCTNESPGDQVGTNSLQFTLFTGSSSSSTTPTLNPNGGLVSGSSGLGISVSTGLSLVSGNLVNTAPSIFTSSQGYSIFNGSIAIGYSTLSTIPTGNALSVSGNINASSLSLTTPLSISSGGTGVSTIPYGIVFSNGTSLSSVQLVDGGIPIGNSSGGVSVESGATLKSHLGLAIGSNVQAWNSVLDTLASLQPAQGVVIVGNGTSFTTSTVADLIANANSGSGSSTSTVDNTNWAGVPLSVSNGGTGNISFTSGSIPYYNGTTFTSSNIGITSSGLTLGTTFVNGPMSLLGTGLSFCSSSSSQLLWTLNTDYTGNFVVSGNGGVSTLSISTAGISTFTQTTDSTSTSTGSVVISGGLGVSKTIYAGSVVTQSLTLTGAANLSLSGGSLTFNSAVAYATGITIGSSGTNRAMAVVSSGGSSIISLQTVSNNVSVGWDISAKPDSSLNWIPVSVVGVNSGVSSGTGVMTLSSTGSLTVSSLTASTATIATATVTSVQAGTVTCTSLTASTSVSAPTVTASTLGATTVNTGTLTATGAIGCTTMTAPTVVTTSVSIGGGNLVGSSGSVSVNGSSGAGMVISSSGNATFGNNVTVVGNLVVQGTVNSQNPTETVTSPSLTLIPGQNVATANIYSTKLVSANGSHLLYVNITVHPTLADENTTFTISLPLSTTLTSPLDLFTAQISSYTMGDDGLLMVSLFNSLVYGIVGTTSAQAQFQSNGTGVHYCQLMFAF